VLNAREFIANGGLNAQFLVKFTPQSVTRLFALFNLSTGELPLQRHGLMSRSLTYKQLAILHD
jgi:hypothetical protein